MKSSILFLFFSMSIISSIHSILYIEPVNINENNLDKLQISNGWNFFLLKNSNNNTRVSNKMLIEIMFSHPSRYNITFNKYKKDTIIMDDEQKYKPDYTRNQTDLILSEEKDIGKSKLILNISKTEDATNDIIIYIKRNDYYTSGEEDKVMIRYLSNVTNEKYYLKNKTINLEKGKNELNLTFGGISTYSNDSKNLAFLSANYTIDIFEKETLENNLENIYSYALYNDKRISLYHKELRILRDISKSNFININNITIKSKKELLLLIKANAFNSSSILQYEAVTFKLTTDSGAGPDEIDTDKNIKENKPVLTIILAFYSGSVLLTFIIVFIYLSIKKKNDANNNKNADEYDYKNIGEIKTLSEDD